MNTVEHRYALPIFGLLVIAALLAGHGEVRAQSAEDPLSLEQVERLVESGVTNNRIIALAARNKLAFRMDQAAERRLRSAGADDELLEALAGIVVAETGRSGSGGQNEEPAGGDGVGAGPSHTGSVPDTAPRGPALSATGAAILSIPLPGIPLMTRSSPGPLIGLGIIGALGYLAWDFNRFHGDREAFKQWDGAGQPPLDMTMEEADSVYDAKASTIVGVYIAQIFLTYFLWDELTPHPATIQPFMAADPRAWRLTAGVRVPVPHRAALTGR